MNQDDWMNILSGIGGNSTAPRRPHVSPSPRPHFPKPVVSQRVTLAEKIYALKASEMVREILVFVDAHGLPRESWYAGVSSTPWARLHDGHGLRINDPRNIWDAGSETVARQVERELLRLGFDGGTGGGNDIGPKFVYVFLQRSHTRR